MSNPQSGNVLFYVLVAVVLLGALTYAVTQTSRSGGTGITAERARIFATELLEDANSFAAATSQLRLRGVAPTAMCFDHASWGGANYNYAACTEDKNKLYAPDGGGLNWSSAPEEAMDSATTPDNLWHFYGNNEVEGVGTTAGDATSADLIVMVDELALPVCQQINKLLGVTTSADTAPPTDTAYGATRFIGAFAYTETIGDEDALLAGKTAACVNAGGEYAFYKVLIAR
jgi:hypothetical protein